MSSLKSRGRRPPRRAHPLVISDAYYMNAKGSQVEGTPARAVRGAHPLRISDVHIAATIIAPESASAWANRGCIEHSFLEQKITKETKNSG
jgi:hypothetical protein